MKKLFTSLGLVVVFSFVFGNFVQADFTDVPANYQYYEAIDDLEERNVVTNKSLFYPDRKITRIEFTKLLLRNTGYDPSNNEKLSVPYSDLEGFEEYNAYINYAYQLGLTPGGQYFYPNRQINKFEIIRSVFALEGIPVPRYNSQELPFKDVALDSLYNSYVVKAIDLNLVSPLNSKIFGLFRNVSRGETADILYRINKLNTEEPRTQAETTQSDAVISSLPKGEILQNVYENIVNNYVDSDQLSEEDKEELVYSAIEAMVEKLRDPHSLFLNPVEAEGLQDALNSNLEGIGAYVGRNDGDQIYIIAPVKDSPAEKAGIQAGDLIIAIDGETTTGLAIYEAIEKIKGPAGTDVKLTIQRPSSDYKKMEISVTREALTIATVEWKMDDSLAYITIKQFGSNTSIEFREIADKVKSENPQGIILDLRNNPGGYLSTAVYLLGYFLEKDSIAVQIEYVDNLFVEKVKDRDYFQDLPLVILMNKGSASSSEILIGALSELRDAVLIGETSYGKGTVQELTFYEDGASLKLTVAKWLTPSGKNINHDGFEPDVEIEDDTKTTSIDEAYEKAKTELKKLVR